MALSDENSRRIQDYLGGSMSVEEQRQLEEDCTRNKELAAELTRYRRVFHTLGDKETFAFREQVSESIKQQQSFDNKKRRVAWGMILSLLTILFIGALLYYSWQPSKTLETPAKQQVQPNIPAQQLLPSNSIIPDSIRVVMEDNRGKPLAEIEQGSDSKSREAREKTPLRGVVKNITYDSIYQQVALAEYQANTFVFMGIISESEAVDNSQLALNYFAQAVSTTDIARKQNYLEKVIGLLDNTLVKNDKRLLLTRAQAFFQTKRYSQAAVDYQALHENFIYGHSADWGLVVCYLAQMPDSENDFQDAINIILDDTSHSFASRALLLREKVAQIR